MVLILAAITNHFCFLYQHCPPVRSLPPIFFECLNHPICCNIPHHWNIFQGNCQWNTSQVIHCLVPWQSTPHFWCMVCEPVSDSSFYHLYSWNTSDTTHVSLDSLRRHRDWISHTCNLLRAVPIKEKGRNQESLGMLISYDTDLTTDEGKKKSKTEQKCLKGKAGLRELTKSISDPKSPLNWVLCLPRTVLI